MRITYLKGVPKVMKKVLKSLLCVVLAVGFILALAGCARINYVTNGTIKAIKEVQDGSYKNGGSDATDDSAQTDVTIDPFVANTYGGVEFKTEEDLVNYYVECYNNTKSQTANYIDADGNTQKFYSLLGEEKLTIGKTLIEGSENSVINALVPGIVDSLFQPNIYGLPPCNNRNPQYDNSNGDPSNPGTFDFRKSYLTVDDVQACNAKDNGDGTITLVIMPKSGSMSMRGEDPQGRFFQVLGDIGATVDSISVLSWASGTTEENCIVDYSGGTGTITIDTATKTITAADYHMAVKVEVNHASITVIKDKSASIDISYDLTYPASDKYLKDTKDLTRA